MFESHLRCLFFFFFFFFKNKVFKYFSTSFPCKVKLSFYPNKYLSFTEAFDVGGETPASTLTRS